MFGREESIYIEAAPEAVFNYVADLRRHAEWAAQAMKIAVESGPDTFFSSTVRLGGGKMRAYGHMITAEPPVRFIYECRDSSGHYRWSMLLQAEGTGTRLIQRMERLQGPWWIRLIQPHFLWPLHGRPSVQKGLANIKARLEAGKQPGAARNEIG